MSGPWLSSERHPEHVAHVLEKEKEPTAKLFDDDEWFHLSQKRKQSC